jgi:pilus assembly protein CpaE
MHYNSGVLSVAFILVGIDPHVGDELAESVGQMSWAVSRADCDTYISAERRPAFSSQVKAAHSCIAVIDFDKDVDQAIVTAAYLQVLYGGRAALIAMSSSQDADLMLRAMRAGCTEFIGGDVDHAVFGETLTRLFLQWSTTTTRATPRGSILTFIGAKGGVGTTTLAVHLAMYLVQVHHKKTLLIDARPQLGHACIYLGLDGSRYHFQELVRNLSRLDSDLLRGYVATHPSGLEVLASPDTCGGSHRTDPESIAQTLDFLRGEYDYVIVDCSTVLDEINHAVIEVSNHVYLIATPEIGAIRDLSRYVDTLTPSEHNVDKMQIVINRFSSQHAVNLEQIEKAIRLPVAIKLPNSYAELVRSAILGEPLSHKIKSEFAAPMLKWAHSLAGTAPMVESGPPQKKKLFALWK